MGLCCCPFQVGELQGFFRREGLLLQLEGSGLHIFVLAGVFDLVNSAFP